MWNNNYRWWTKLRQRRGRRWHRPPIDLDLHTVLKNFIQAFPTFADWRTFLGDTTLQGWAKEWSLGCVNLASWLPLAAGREFTQPSDPFFVQPCTYVKHWVRFLWRTVKQVYQEKSTPGNSIYQIAPLRGGRRGQKTWRRLDNCKPDPTRRVLIWPWCNWGVEMGSAEVCN